MYAGKLLFTKRIKVDSRVPINYVNDIISCVAAVALIALLLRIILFVIIGVNV